MTCLSSSWCLDEGVEEFVVEGFALRLAGERLSKVRAALASHRHVLGCGREPDDVGHVVGEHRLVPRDAQLQLRVVLRYPIQYRHHPCAVVVVGDSREELVERCDCHGFTLRCKRADQQRIVLSLSTLCKTKGAARGVPRAAP